MTLLDKKELNNDVHISIESKEKTPKIKINTRCCEKVESAEAPGGVFSISLRNDFVENEASFKEISQKINTEHKISNNIPSLRIENESLDLFSSNYDSVDIPKKKLYLRCFSEPPNTQFDNNFIQHSPTIKLLFKNMRKTSNQTPNSNKNLTASTQSILESKIQLDSNPIKKLLKLSIEDLLSIFSWKQLAFKRSFSATKLKLEKKIIKKSPSFKNFLKNVLKGKQRSNSMCNFNNGNLNNHHHSDFSLKTSRRASTNFSFKEQQTSGESSNSLDQMMMLIMNNTTWPVLKIDSVRNSTVELNQDTKEVGIIKKEGSFLNFPQDDFQADT